MSNWETLISAPLIERGARPLVALSVRAAKLVHKRAPVDDGVPQNRQAATERSAEYA